MACRHGHVEAAKALLAGGADASRVRAACVRRWALHGARAAARAPDARCGARAQAGPDSTPLMEAATCGSGALVQLLLDAKADAQAGLVRPRAAACTALLSGRRAAAERPAGM